MRVFIGIQLSTYTKRKIKNWQSTYQSYCHSDGIRWTRGNNLHITLLPPWEEKEIPVLIQKLKNHLSSAPFKITLSKILFVPGKKPSYIWIEGKTPLVLLDIRHNIASVLEKRLEKRRFRLHATIARLAKDAEVTSVTELVQWRMKVDSLTLFASHLSQKGTEYKIIATFPLE